MNAEEFPFLEELKKIKDKKENNTSLIKERTWLIGGFSILLSVNILLAIWVLQISNEQHRMTPIISVVEKNIILR